MDTGPSTRALVVLRDEQEGNILQRRKWYVKDKTVGNIVSDCFAEALMLDVPKRCVS